MLDDLGGQRNVAQRVVGARIEFQRTLVFQLADDVALDDVDGRLGVDEMVVEDLLERNERIIGLLLESPVAVAGELRIEIRVALFPQLADARLADFGVVGDGFTAALELAGDAFRLIDEEHHDVERRLPETMSLRSVGELTAQQDHLIVEHLEALHLHVGARETIEHRAVAKFRLQHLAQQQTQHFLVAHHAAAGLDFAGLRRVQQLADDDRFRG